MRYCRPIWKDTWSLLEHVMEREELADNNPDSGNDSFSVIIQV